MALRWTWYSEHKKETWLETFASPGEAIEAMAKRHGDEIPMQRLAEIGFRLALVEVIVKPIMILEDVK